jgi:diphosphomevalonate decarboxylase
VKRTALAHAHANIAFSKYWGKRPYPGNYPAVPSLSLTLDAMTTRTRVTFDDALSGDTFALGGADQAGRPLERVVTLLTRVRDAAGFRTFAAVQSDNDFPTAGGLASSASGFAALALAAVHAAGLDWDLSRVSDLARRSSASAARSLFGGFVELRAGPEAETGGVLAAESLVPAGALDWRLLVVAMGEAQKDVSSSDGMVRTAAESPYYPAWLETAPRLHESLRDALLARDFQRFGAFSERSALAMHASAFAAGVVYFQAPTLAVLGVVRALRAGGTPVFATMDAGPHVKVLALPADASSVAVRLREVTGVARVFEAKGAEGARLVEGRDGGLGA